MAGPNNDFLIMINSLLNVTDLSFIKGITVWTEFKLGPTDLTCLLKNLGL